MRSKFFTLVALLFVGATAFVAGNVIPQMLFPQISLSLQNTLSGYTSSSGKSEIGTGSINASVPAPLDLTQANLSLLVEAYHIVSESFYGFRNVDEATLVRGMVRGMTEALGDKHTTYFDAKETQSFEETLRGDFEGIGAEVNKDPSGAVIVERVIANSPAKKAGVFAGDLIIKAGDIDLLKLTLTQAVEKIRGPAGSQVALLILRAGEKAPLTITVTRDKIVSPTVESKVLEGNIGYIALTIFGEKSSEDFARAAIEMKNKHVRAIILDLRDNPGGLLDKAVDILSHFVPKGKVLVSTRDRDPRNNETYFSHGFGTLASLPVVILVNGSSASASEIVSGALQDYNLALLVGEKTYGKGSVQRPFPLSDGSEMKVTIANWYTPNDHAIDKIGIEPDVAVKFTTEDFALKRDSQLIAGQNVIKKWLESNRSEARLAFTSGSLAASGNTTQSASGASASGTRIVPSGSGVSVPR